MNQFDSLTADQLRDGTGEWLTDEQLRALSTYPLESIEQVYPHYVRAVEEPDQTFDPREDHPIFFGCYDWHSAVHSHWSLVRQLRLFPDHPEEAAIRDSFAERITPENVEGECEYFEENPTFEMPYGWSWLLRLIAELHAWEDPQGTRWREILSPLEDQIRELVETEFLTRDRPFRVGTHTNSAFGLRGIQSYARAIGDSEFASTVSEHATLLYAADEGYSLAYEPLGWDFLSPGLTEAALMGQVYAGEEFTRWFDRFLPGLTEDGSVALSPISVDPDTEDGLELHFVGLNLSRAWCLFDLAEAVGDETCTATHLLREAGLAHAKAGIEHAFTDAYAGAHWLSSFVLALLTRRAEPEW